MVGSGVDAGMVVGQRSPPAFHRGLAAMSGPKGHVFPQPASQALVTGTPHTTSGPRRQPFIFGLGVPIVRCAQTTALAPSCPASAQMATSPIFRGGGRKGWPVGPDDVVGWKITGPQGRAGGMIGPLGLAGFVGGVTAGPWG